MSQDLNHAPTNSQVLADLGEEQVEQNHAPVEFYDPSLDEENEVWANSQRQGRKSDAVLSCPACFTILCIDCQRHEIYETQYRAMFVRNCKVSENERLHFPAQNKRKRNCDRKGQKLKYKVEEISGDSLFDERDIFKSVHCSVCDTEVAVLDKEEIYHFFNVMPSYS
ncbi:hypothetical protein O6H91_Y451400 [Diphasiastrum complanatum]|nr:hypothetical protein O6H91_Y451400 [Diphasiastrum complanatum]